MKSIQKKDLQFIAVLIIIVCIVGACTFLLSKGGHQVVVTLNNEVYGEYDISKDQMIHIEVGDGYNTISIKNNEVIVSESTCLNQVCVHSLPISANYKGSIICMPHNLIVEMKE